MTSWKNLIKVVDNKIIKSPTDPRIYRVIQLTNGLQMCLISDPDADMSAAAMDVHVGYMSDPDDIPGIAHLCEHMLFLGTEKYDKENDFDKFIRDHAGDSNASTKFLNTMYHFDVNPEYLADALDRFAQFFICPLFMESAIEREVNAVNSEHERKTTDESRRIEYAERATMSPCHPFCKFPTGNKDTLLNIPQTRGQCIRDELLKFYDKYYSSNIMALAVLGKESLDELEQMTVPLFGKIKDKDLTIPIWRDNPIREEDTKVETCVMPITDIDRLTLTWPIEEYRSYPSQYLCYLFNQEGHGSLKYELRKKGWIVSLYGFEYGPLGFSFFVVKVGLTKHGMEHTVDIITNIFQYINMLKRNGTQKWIWDQRTQMQDLHFCFMDIIDPVECTKSLASNLQAISTNPNVTSRNFIRYAFVNDEYQPDLVDKLIEKLNPENMSDYCWERV